MRNGIVAVSGLGIFVLFVFATGGTAEARPNYFPEFKAAYPTVKEAEVVKCGVCHVGKPTAKTWNDYGTAFGKSLGKTKAKTDEAKAALQKVEKEPSSVDGKTFGDLLKEGKLPGAAPTQAD